MKFKTNVLLKIRFFKKRKWIFFTAFVSSLIIIWFASAPRVLFDDPFSTVLEDRTGALLGASIAKDGQWRFPENKSISGKFKTALMTYEDKRFEDHHGVDVVALGRALRQNIAAAKVVSGGSTLTMQLIRLSRKEQQRTLFEKCYEILLAVRLELKYPKEKILSLYAAHAPMGGNVVGTESACWRYFGRGSSDMSWAEAALLAVLPNSPALIHPGKNRDRLKLKRDRLLRKMNRNGAIDLFTLSLALAEPIPENPLPLPRYARHLLDRAMHEGHAQTRVNSTIDLSLQRKLEQIVAAHHQRLKGNQIFNAAAIVLDVRTGNVLGYVGNTEAGAANQQDVDVVASRRSTGSILKPFLFAAMLDDGKMLQKTLLPDVPLTINGFTPHNFSHEYDGVVAADKALIRSLNIPMVCALREYRYERFYDVLTNAGITTLTQQPDHYGLSMILGGAEGSLWDITGAYASMARTLDNYFEYPGDKKYNTANFHAPVYVSDAGKRDSVLTDASFLSAASIWQTFESLKELYRPGEETGWRYFNASKKIAWKTGTSFGFRDGWAVGVNPDYAVGVWVGNADGEGRPGLVGTETAAPVLFDIFSTLPGQPWFRQPQSEMTQVAVCAKSGQRASSNCDETNQQWITRAGLISPSCQFHRKIHLTENEKFRVHSECVPVDQIKTKSWFVLSPVQEFYFKSKNLSYLPMPPFRKDCADPSAIAPMDFIYPKSSAKIYLPKDLDGVPGRAVFEIAHRQPDALLYWHLDGVYISTTKTKHLLALAPPKGNHVLTVVDDAGETLERAFEVLSSP